jgi:hypothetical protein
VAAGDRIVAEGPEEREMTMAMSVKVGGAPTAAKKARTAATK